MYRFDTIEELLGARESEVDEPDSGVTGSFNRVEPILCLEFEAYPEAKMLKPIDLRQLTIKYGSYSIAAKHIGASEAFVRQNSSKP